MAMVRRAGIERAQLLVEAARRGPLQTFLRSWLQDLRAQKSRIRWQIEVDPPKSEAARNKARHGRVSSGVQPPRSFHAQDSRRPPRRRLRPGRLLHDVRCAAAPTKVKDSVLTNVSGMTL